MIISKAVPREQSKIRIIFLLPKSISITIFEFELFF